jgi:mannose-binding lectin 2
VEGRGTWTECFSIDNVRLPTNYYFGFTAATGELSDNHDIISVHTYQLDSSEQRRMEDRNSIIPSAPSPETGVPTTTTTQSSTWSALKIFFLIIGLIIICLGGIGAYYYRQNRRSGPRFY